MLCHIIPHDIICMIKLDLEEVLHLRLHRDASAARRHELRPGSRERQVGEVLGRVKRGMFKRGTYLRNSEDSCLKTTQARSETIRYPFANYTFAFLRGPRRGCPPPRRGTGTAAVAARRTSPGPSRWTSPRSGRGRPYYCYHCYCYIHYQHDSYHQL